LSNNWKNRYLRQIVVRWFKKSQDNQQGLDDFDRFIALWISFDAWGCNESGAMERSMINWVAGSSMAQVFRKAWPQLEPDLIALKSKGPIPNYVTGNPVTINNLRDFKEVMEAIYLIRNNLFHGHKSPDDKDDQEFVNLAYHIMSVLLEPFAKGLDY